jgi:hypothetical protein
MLPKAEVTSEQVARMSAAICGDQDWFPDVASLIRATLADSDGAGEGMQNTDPAGALVCAGRWRGKQQEQ